MSNVFDVADHVLARTGYVSTMKLQKLVYYSQALFLVRYRRPLFEETFEAWANGPVCRALFNSHRRKFVIGPDELEVTRRPVPLVPCEAGVVDDVVSVLSPYTGDELSRLTHSERPWLDARSGCADGERCSNPISNESILAFYSSPECANPVFAVR